MKPLPPNNFGLGIGQTPAQQEEAECTGLSAPPVVPAGGFIGSSGWLAERIFQGVEFLVTLIALIIALPLMLLIAVVVRLDSPGPALFFHKRPGRSKIMRGRDLYGRQDVRPPPGGFKADSLYYVPSYFTLVKFRTMYDDARTRFPELYAYKYTPEEFRRHYPTNQHDPRVTRAGRFLRSRSVDELPNLLSVLTGDLRLVGPRPEAPEVLRYYTPEEMYKFACKPGITGLAQVNGRGLLNWGETIAFDLEYVRTRSVGLDLRIILMTLKRIITRHGAF
jgi:lipopolysaccharide/colanic/teichoic acid biosynthesis glycosyltransferase